MKKTGLIKAVILVLAIPILNFGIISMSPVYADAVSQGDACAGLNQLDNSTSSDCSNLTTQGSSFTSTVKAVVNILSWIVGVVAIVMVLVSGLKYITSGGDANKVGSAKNTLIYAMIGIAVAALAQVLVHFVLSSATNATTQCPSNPSVSVSDISACKSK